MKLQYGNNNNSNRLCFPALSPTWGQGTKREMYNYKCEAILSWSLRLGQMEPLDKTKIM